MIKKQEFILKSVHSGRGFSVDFRCENTIEGKPVILFLHGFKGFKDWGSWDLAADFFAQNGFVFVKMNFSHNGTAVRKADEFVDLEAFGRNTFGIEADDLDLVLDCLQAADSPISGADTSKIGLAAHSRGAATAVFKVATDSRIKCLSLWAPVPDVFAMFNEKMKKDWENYRPAFVFNGRTQQNMPLYTDIWEEICANRAGFDVQKITAGTTLPLQIIHGDADPTVNVSAAEMYKNSRPDTQIHIISGADHVFGCRHPRTSEKMPPHFQELCENSTKFFTENL